MVSYRRAPKILSLWASCYAELCSATSSKAQHHSTFGAKFSSRSLPFNGVWTTTREKKPRKDLHQITCAKYNVTNCWRLTWYFNDLSPKKEHLLFFKYSCKTLIKKCLPKWPNQRRKCLWFCRKHLEVFASYWNICSPKALKHALSCHEAVLFGSPMLFNGGHPTRCWQVDL